MAAARALPGLVLVAGRYEGIDERVLELAVDQELSIGDYVLSGGELPALVLIDALARLLARARWAMSARASRSRSVMDCWTGRITRGRKCSQGRRVPAVLSSGRSRGDPALAAASRASAAPGCGDRS